MKGGGDISRALANALAVSQVVAGGVFKQASEVLGKDGASFVPVGLSLAEGASPAPAAAREGDTVRVTIPIGLTDIGKWKVRFRSTANGSNQGAGAREWPFQVVASTLTNPQ